MEHRVNLYEAKTQLSALVEQAARGEEIVIAKAGKPKARLVALEAPKREPVKLGQKLLGVTPEMYEPLPEDIIDMMYNGPIDPAIEPE